jgi:hypothetical protein
MLRVGHQTVELEEAPYQSDQYGAPDHLSRQGPPTLHWVLYEAVQTA